MSLMSEFDDEFDDEFGNSKFDEFDDNECGPV
jgi:hypothetical protein